MIIGTAGHIDHGKTTLVRALTGVDTDRLKEEKARGISIELGYAYIPLPNGDVLGFIDVPGHEKFIHTMAAGATGIDHGLLVVAADDGVMPQTREHLAILQLLGVRGLSVAISKADRVDATQRQQVRAQVLDLVASHGWPDPACFEVSAVQPDDAGTAALRDHLLALAEHTAARPADALFRLAVDRVFTLPGQGTVVTGTVHGGQVRVGDTLSHSASGHSVRVRSIHAQNRASDSGQAGQRCALNLVGLERQQISRGDWIADPRALHGSRRIDVRVRTLPGAPTLQTWTPVHVHLGTAHHMAHIALLEGEQLAPATQARVQLVFDEPVFGVAGDRAILRDAQASQTLAGATLLDTQAPDRKRRSAARVAYLDLIEAVLDQPGAATLQALVAQAPYGLALSALEQLLARPAASLPLGDDWVRLERPGLAGDRLLLTPARWQALREQILATLDQFHQRSPDDPGPDSARLRRMSWPGLAQDSHALLWRGLLDGLLRDGEIVASGAWLHRPGHSVQLSDAEEVLAQKLLPALVIGGYDPPWVRDLARDHQTGEEAVRQLLRKLARRGDVYQVVPDLFYATLHIEALAQIVAELAPAADTPAAPGSHGHGIEARLFRDATGLGRKRAIQILEFFNRVGYTRRVRDAHLLRPDSHWRAQQHNGST